MMAIFPICAGIVTGLVIGFWSEIHAWWKNRSKPEQYDGQHIIERYRDFKLIAVEYKLCINGCCLEKRKTYTETVKFLCTRGNIGIGHRLVRDDSTEFRRFE